MSAKFAFIDAEKAPYSIVKMCAWMGVSTSGFYEWRDRPASATARRRDRLATLIEWIFNDSDQTYGHRRIHAALLRQGERLTPELVRAIMRELGLIPCQPRPFRPTTTVGGDAGPVPDLVARDFHADAPGSKLVGDITYLPTWEGWLYLLLTWNLTAGRIITDRHRYHVVRGPVARECGGEVARPGPARTSRRVARRLDQPGPGAAHHRRVCARAGGVSAGL